MFLGSSRSSPIQTRNTLPALLTRFKENPLLKEQNNRHQNRTEHLKRYATVTNINDGKLPTTGFTTKKVITESESENPLAFQYNLKKATADHKLFYKLYQGAKTRVKRQQCSTAVTTTEACDVVMVTCGNGCGMQTCSCRKTGDVIPIRCIDGSNIYTGYCH